jgi:hypothetical protein
MAIFGPKPLVEAPLVKFGKLLTAVVHVPSGHPKTHEKGLFGASVVELAYSNF